MTENSQSSGIDDHTMNSTLNDALDHPTVPSDSSPLSSNSHPLFPNPDADDHGLVLPGSNDLSGAAGDGNLSPHHRHDSPAMDATAIDSGNANTESSTDRVTTRRRGRGSKKSSRHQERSSSKSPGDENANDVCLLFPKILHFYIKVEH